VDVELLLEERPSVCDPRRGIIKILNSEIMILRPTEED